MTDEYDAWIAKQWDGGQPAQHPRPVPFSMLAAMGLAGETGEVMELLKKHARDGKHPGQDIALELGDVVHYATVIAQAYGFSLSEVLRMNVHKLVRRDAEKQEGK